jgi:hypothetical protein
MSSGMSSFPFAFVLLRRIVNDVRESTSARPWFFLDWSVVSECACGFVLSSALGHSVRKHVSVHVTSCQLA